MNHTPDINHNEKRKPLTRAKVFAMSWPIMLANAATPLSGFVDTIVIGRYSTTSALAAIGLGVIIYAIFYWSFGFLRMSTGGLTAQSEGQNDELQIQAHLFRALPLGLIIGTIILLIQIPLLKGLFKLYTASPAIESGASDYVSARLWGLPAYLGGLAMMGWFIGLGQSGRALIMQIWLNTINIILSILFVAGMGLGIKGAGWATAIAEWNGLIAGVFIAWQEIKSRGGLIKGALSKPILLALDQIKKLGISNFDIFIRTIVMVYAFNFFGNAAASQGETFLAGHHILMQFVVIIALVLDGFAHTAEATVGAAYGAKDKKRFDHAVRLTTEFSVVFAFLLCGFTLLAGPIAIIALTPDIEVQTQAFKFLIFCALVPVAGFGAWHLDGIFIGTTQTKAMRNGAIWAALIYLGAHFILAPKFGAYGIWSAFLIYYLARALVLLIELPTIRAQTN